MDPNSVNIVNLPKLPPDAYTKDNRIAHAIASKNRELRLHALKTAPEAFASSFEQEVERDLSDTLERLKTVHADHFFAVDRSVSPWMPERSEEFFSNLIEATWVGMIVLIGPLSPSGSAAMSAKHDPLTKDGSGRGLLAAEQTRTGELSYHINGTFVDPEARGAGLGRAMIETAVAKGWAEAFKRGLRLHCTVLVDSENAAAMNLYNSTGFCAVGEEIYVQQPRTRMGEWKADERVAIRMELLR